MELIFRLEAIVYAVPVSQRTKQRLYLTNLMSHFSFYSSSFSTVLTDLGGKGLQIVRISFACFDLPPIDTTASALTLVNILVYWNI